MRKSGPRVPIDAVTHRGELGEEECGAAQMVACAVIALCQTVSTPVDHPPIITERNACADKRDASFNRRMEKG